MFYMIQDILANSTLVYQVLQPLTQTLSCVYLEIWDLPITAAHPRSLQTLSLFLGGRGEGGKFLVNFDKDFGYVAPFLWGY